MPDYQKKDGFLTQRAEENNSITTELLIPMPPFPKNIMIELSNACNSTCVFCTNSKMTRPKGVIRDELLDSVLNQAYKLGTREVGFYTTGEPFVYKRLPEVIQKAKQLGYEYVYLTTNGALAVPDRAVSVIQAGLDSIKFSINAANEQTYHRIHGKDDFNTVIDNLRFIKEYRDKHSFSMRIGVSYVVTDDNRNEKNIAVQLLTPLVDDLIFAEQGNQGGYMNENNVPPIMRVPCSMLFKRFHVSHEGYYTMCCVDYQNYLAVADLNNVSLAEAWTSELAVEMRKRHIDRRIEGTLCHNCIKAVNDNVKPLIEKYATIFDFNKS